jgi:LytS/YehU family sensor histidine kinase
LVQRAVRDASGAASSVRIGVDRVGDEIIIVLRLGGRASCGEDAELARVRERLVGLYGARATLECCELAGPTTQFTLRVPAAVAPAP